MLDAATFIDEAWQTISTECINNSFRKAGIISDFISEDSEVEPEGFDDFLQLLSACSMKEEDKNKLTQEISFILHMDDENSDEYQTELLKEVDLALTCESTKPSKSLPSDEEDNEEEEEEEGEEARNHQELSDAVDFNSVLKGVLSLSNDFQQLKKLNTVPEKEIKNCIEAVCRLQACVQQANSAMVHKKILQTKQITLHDCYRPKK